MDFADLISNLWLRSPQLDSSIACVQFLVFYLWSCKRFSYFVEFENKENDKKVDQISERPNMNGKRENVFMVIGGFRN